MSPMRPRSSLSSLMRSTMTSAYLPLRLWRTSESAVAHARAKAPVAGAAGHDHAVELVRAHLVAQRRITARIFLFREMVVDRVPVIGRVVHVREGGVLIEPLAHFLPALVSRGRRV